MPDSVHVDERTVAVENASYRWGYVVLTFGILAIAAYRGIARNENTWDLLALVIIGGLVTTLYQWRGLVLTRRWLLMSIATMALAVVIGFLAIRAT